MAQQLAVGIDIGGTGIKFGIANRNGDVLVKGSMPTKGHETVDDFIAALKNQLQPMLDKAGKENVIGVGIGAPNANHFTGEIMFAPNLPWKGVIPLAKLVKEALGLKVTITNDAKAAAIGEMMYGAAKGMKDFIQITLGTGVGSGFVANGELIYGHDGFAGELGHVIAVRDGRQCGCGRKGCLETYTSATGIVRTAEEWLAMRSDETILRQHTGAISAITIDEAAKKGDAFALEIFEFTGKILGQVLADTVAITSPEAIILFGGLAKSGALLMNPLKKHFEENLLMIYKDKVVILYSALEDDNAAILGASALVW